MKLELHPQAETELLEASSWYDEQLPGLGDDLLAELAHWLQIIAEAPLAWPKWPDGPALEPPIRRVLADRFPYAIASRAWSDRIQILAFAHASRRPFHWKGRTEI
ncbi:MAG: type II toxin-antitoxin system RelE/ParE family toxin [Planctomycetes bacterium]|nr:type II toxin-antitoxin system RelE/ParE family toxin [Planctomycetota bacterium]